MINSRNIMDLHPTVRPLVFAFIKECANHGIEVLITSTYRDNESQAALYAIGRTKPGKKVTNAGPGQSMHNYRLAFDFVVIENGKAVWNDKAAFERCGIIAEKIGLTWAGRWKKFPELAHCQFTGGLSLKDLQEGKTLNEDIV
jgi:peptidoglycan LD-endopeptidase CwlK